MFKLSKGWKCFVIGICFCSSLWATEYEAEEALLNGTETKSHAEASGGFRVIYFDQDGDSISFNSIDSGNRLVITYSLGISASKQCSIYSNNQDVATAVFPPTGSWDNYATIELPMPIADDLMLKLDPDDQTANANTSCSSIDKIETTTLADSPFWRSSLYPDNWTPGYKDAQDRFLHDFSYAGYHNGQCDMPTNLNNNIINVTQAPYNADPTGINDSTLAIQAAINVAGTNGQTIVYLPEGKYRVKPQGTNSYALLIEKSNIILRGDGPNLTKIFNDDPYMRSKSVISVSPANGSNAWFAPLPSSDFAITEDITFPTHIIGVSDVTSFTIGDWIIIRTDCTEAFIADHNMSGIWNSSLKGIAIYRKITDIDPDAKTITIDIPTRYWMKTRDNARLYKITPHLEEVGVEQLSIAMRENTKSGLGSNDYVIPGTAAYEVHGSHAIKFSHVVNGWIKNFSTYRPEENTNNYHTVSNVILLEKCRNVTVLKCDVARPQYEGGGGNGYGYTLRSNDCLLVDCKAYHTRHNYDFKSMWTCGNVIFRCETKDGHLRSDFHMHLSPANLIDSNYVDNDTWEAKYRPYGTVIHGHTTSQTVFWNTYGTGSKSTLIESKQWGQGYVIGTSGPVNKVVLGNSYGSEPEDLLEGQGVGDTLEPQSLFLDQLKRRAEQIPAYLHNCQNDLNGDGSADILDFAYFFEHWLDCGAVPHYQN